MEKKEKRKRTIPWPPIGQRIIKTSLAVTLCLFFYLWRGYQGESMPAEAASVLNRLAGTMIGAFWGFVFLLLMLMIPVLNWAVPILYLMMGLGTLISLYSAVLVRRQDAAGLAAIVFVCVVIAFPDIANPMEQAFHRILDVLAGTLTALFVNAFRLPRIKLSDRVFFVRMQDLTEDQFSCPAPAALFRLQNLYQEGAKICLISEHAPAFHASQLNHVKFTVPLIVMDGTALYDANENTYLSVSYMDSASCRWLIKRLQSMNVSFFVYTLHRDRNFIYHSGVLSERERQLYLRLKKSPYRYYLDDDHYSVSDVVYLKIITSKDQAEHIKNVLQPMMEKMKLRSVIRSQDGIESSYSLYFYAEHADVEHAQAHLIRLLKQKEPAIEMYNVFSRGSFHSENDAVRLLKTISREYEPTIFKIHRVPRLASRLQKSTRWICTTPSQKCTTL